MTLKDKSIIELNELKQQAIKQREGIGYSGSSNDFDYYNKKVIPAINEAIKAKFEELIPDT